MQVYANKLAMHRIILYLSQFLHKYNRHELDGTSKYHLI